MKTILLKYSATLLTSACFALSTARSFAEAEAPDAAAITAAAESFHKALAAGKPDEVMSLLQPDALIVEAGAVQTRAEYQREHLAADIAYARAVSGKPRDVIVRQEGNIAWVTSTFEVSGTFEGKPVHSFSAETMVLTRTDGGWRIRNVHWSSHKASKG